jgi:hypothetical protein
MSLPPGRWSVQVGVCVSASKMTAGNQGPPGGGPAGSEAEAGAAVPPKDVEYVRVLTALADEAHGAVRRARDLLKAPGAGTHAEAGKLLSTAVESVATLEQSVLSHAPESRLMEPLRLKMRELRRELAGTARLVDGVMEFVAGWQALEQVLEKEKLDWPGYTARGCAALPGAKPKLDGTRSYYG